LPLSRIVDAYAARPCSSCDYVQAARPRPESFASLVSTAPAVEAKLAELAPLSLESLEHVTAFAADAADVGDPAGLMTPPGGGWW